MKTVLGLGWQFVTRLRGGLEVRVYRRGRKFYATSEFSLEWRKVRRILNPA
ncbi:hypothetical protein [Meiothermus sp. CFH 77666]|uniref:hypothetical protein n=1 Tax=Meiothermus sp. CFH 77666 TaxID=2817942 RepID=UPI001AA09FFC|nr:hypothetical protein [Meiothermus sp. CFH 77666]MBO1437814.1 hypothetical protein [Meiothermus sp. CFH 77666]